MPRPSYFSNRELSINANYIIGSTRDFNMGGGLGLSYCYALAPIVCLDMGGGIDFTAGKGPYPQEGSSDPFQEKGIHPYTQLGLGMFPSRSWGFGLYSGLGYSYFTGKISKNEGGTVTTEDYSGGGLMFRSFLSFIAYPASHIGIQIDGGVKTLPSLMENEDRHWGLEARASFKFMF